MKLLIPLLAVLLCVTAMPAQTQVLADNGQYITVNPNHQGGHGGNGRSAGMLTTLFAQNNGFAGNMFDMTPTLDLEISAIDVNSDGIGAPVLVDVWYRMGTSFGNETNPLGDWMMVGSYSGVAAGADLPTNIDMAGNGVIFSGGVLYGIYVDFNNYPGSGTCRYTNGQNSYSNSDLSIDTNCGKGNPAFSGSTFFPRQWNGTVYYCVGGGGPSVVVSNLIAGATADATVRGATPGGQVAVAYSLAGGGPTTANAGPCGSITVDLSNPITILPFLTADASGVASVSANIPPGTTGVNVWVQGFDIATCTLTNSLAEVIG